MPITFRPSRLLRTVRRVLANDALVIGLMATAVGLVVGGAVIGFREVIGAIQWLSFGTAQERMNNVAAELPWWRIVLPPTLGGVLIGFVLRRTPARPGPRGVAEVIEAAISTRGHMPLGRGLLTALMAAAAIGTGGSVGREGPAVHLGGTLAGWIAARLRMGRNLGRTLLGCGVAAAVAASFNAPIAGALFAHEVVVGRFALPAFAPIVMASIAATLVSRAWFGDFPAFALPAMQISAWHEFVAAALLGLACAVLGVLFIRCIALVRRLVAGLGLELRMGFAGLLLGLIAVAFPQVLGVGYEATEEALHAAIEWRLLIALLVAKLLASALCLGAGFPGGVFGPSLVLGAFLGGLFGTAAQALMPEASSGAFALIGMGAVASAVLGAPISTTIIVFEMTGDYNMTVAVLLASVVASTVSQQLLGAPSFFEWELKRKGVDAPDRPTT